MKTSAILKRGRLLLLAGLAVAAFGLVACSDDDGDDDPAPTSTTAAAATGATGATGGAGAEDPTATPEADPTEAPQPTAEPTEAAAPEVIEVGLDEGELGSYLVGPDGMTLYVFLRDMPDTVNCAGGCLEAWPPLLVEEGQSVEGGEGVTGTFGTVEMSVGTQVTYNSVPLYYWANDAAVGDTTGHLVGGVWFVAREDSASTAAVIVSPNGDYLIGPTGMTLYTFDNDTEGVSNCTGGCLEAWPALTLPEGLAPVGDTGVDGALDVITRDDDGTFQVTYNGLPLYYWVNDMVPGDTTGDGVNNVWHLATP